MHTSGQFTLVNGSTMAQDDAAMKLQAAAIYCTTLAALVGIAVEADLHGPGDPDLRLSKLAVQLVFAREEARGFIPSLPSVPRTDAEQLAIRLAGAYLNQAMEAGRRALHDRESHTDASDRLSMVLQDTEATLDCLRDAALQTWE